VQPEALLWIAKRIEGGTRKEGGCTTAASLCALPCGGDGERIFEAGGPPPSGKAALFRHSTAYPSGRSLWRSVAAFLLVRNPTEELRH